MKNIYVVATGGTIAGSGESAGESKYSSSKLGVEELIKSVPGVNKIANIKAEQLLQIGSQDLNNTALVKISNRVNELLSKRSVDAVVITHGTDTMEETAYFLNLVTHSKKPVILVGAMRPSTSLSADGTLNIYNAIALASSDVAVGKGVMVMMNDTVFAARDVSKTHTTNVASFQAGDAGAIGHVHYGKSEIYYAPLRKHTTSSQFKVSCESELPKVEILYSYASSDSDLVDYFVESGVKAIVVAGVGDGNVSQATLQKLIEARKKGVIIVRSSRVGSGLVVPNVEINDAEFGFVTAGNLNPQKARILTMLALTKTSDTQKIREIFKNY